MNRFRFVHLNVHSHYSINDGCASIKELVDAAIKDKMPGRNDPCPCGSGKKFKNCHGRGIV